MPEMSTQIRTRLRLAPAILVAIPLLAAAALGGCAGGDFGRTRENARSDDMHRWLGIEATASIGLRASQYQLTDKERLLRDLESESASSSRDEPCGHLLSHRLRTVRTVHL